MQKLWGGVASFAMAGLLACAGAGTGGAASEGSDGGAGAGNVGGSPVGPGPSAAPGSLAHLGSRSLDGTWDITTLEGTQGGYVQIAGTEIKIVLPRTTEGKDVGGGCTHTYDRHVVHLSIAGERVVGSSVDQFEGTGCGEEDEATANAIVGSRDQAGDRPGIRGTWFLRTGAKDRDRRLTVYKLTIAEASFSVARLAEGGIDGTGTLEGAVVSGRAFDFDFVARRR